MSEFAQRLVNDLEFHGFIPFGFADVDGSGVEFVTVINQLIKLNTAQLAVFLTLDPQLGTEHGCSREVHWTFAPTRFDNVISNIFQFSLDSSFKS